MTYATKSRFDAARSNRYLHHLNSVSGWLSKFSAEASVALSEFQNERDFQGAVAKIGVHSSPYCRGHFGQRLEKPGSASISRIPVSGAR